MRYKSKVLAQHPDARLVVRRYHDDLVTPRYQSVCIGLSFEQNTLDNHDPDTLWQQGAAAAWRSAYYYLVRQRRAAAGDALVLSVARMLG